MKRLTFLLTFLLSFNLLSQNTQPPPTTAAQRAESLQKLQNLQETSLLNNLPFESKGPSVFGGRVTDIAVNSADPSRFYVAYASGGLFYTESNGAHFAPLFDDQATINIGAVAADWQNNTVWVGTGEVNSSRSSYPGYGVYRSNNGGKTWTHLGLTETHHIGRIVLHPTDPNTVWVAALGSLYSPSAERGIYKTTDGGKTWSKTLFVNENAGAIDLLLDPSNPNELYAATWERTRRAWNFTESGAGSGIYRSTDGGENWTLMTEKKSGFPAGEGTGRIGLALSEKNGNNVLYAVLDNYNRRPEDSDEQKDEGLTKEQLRNMDAPTFEKLDAALVAEFLKSNNFPDKYTEKEVRKMVKEGKITPLALTEYLEDANSLLFDTEVVGTEVYRSDDNGRTWNKTHSDYLDNIFYSYGYYFAQIRVMPDNPDKLYIMGVPILTSDDGGKNWKSLNADNVHVDHHALWLNPARPGHLINGNDGGINISYDDGAHWFKCNTPAVGQFYSVNTDNQKNYNIYGGLQDNGVWMGKHTYEAGVGWHNSGQYGYKSIMGGDGMQVEIDKRDNATVYTGYQFGNYFRLNTETGDRKYITPKHKLGERPLRWNWQAPIKISPHNQDIIYFGSNKLHRSFNQGNDFAEISPDLTAGGIKGDVAYGTITTIDESKLRFGLLYVGTDDGNIHISKDGGNNWTKISNSLPQRMWITRVFASPHDEATVFAALNGYRWNDFSSMIYKSTDYGATWTKIGKNLPLEPVNVIKQDAENAEIIYVGTDGGFYVSLDGGTNFMTTDGGLPPVAVHDLTVQEREKDLILGTHGRSFWLTDIKELRLLRDSILQQELYAFETENVNYRSNWGSSWSLWSDPPVPEVALPIFVKNAGEVKVTIKTEEDLVLHTMIFQADKGLNYPISDLSLDNEKISEKYEKYLNKDLKEDEKKADLEAAKNGEIYLRPGKYKVIFTKNGNSKERELIIKSR